MQQGTGELTELYLENGLMGGRILCPANLIPAPGQYLLAYQPTAPRGMLSYSALPVPVFNAGPIPGGFLIAPPIPPMWLPGTSLSLRGPLGCGFSLPATARRIGLIALGETAARLKPLLTAALRQDAAVVLVSELDLPELPPEVEIQSVSALADVTGWADYLALDLPRESLPALRERLGLDGQAKVMIEAQVLVMAPMPCGGMADCAVCAVKTRRSWKLACKDGPVLKLADLC